MNQKSRYDQLFHAHLTLLQINVEHHKSQLFVKSIAVTLIAGGTVILLTSNSSLISIATTLLLLLALGFLSLMHRDYKHFKNINSRLITEIEYEFIMDKLSLGENDPLLVQRRSNRINAEINKEHPIISKLFFHWDNFYWLTASYSIGILIIDLIFPITLGS